MTRSPTFVQLHSNNICYAHCQPYAITTEANISRSSASFFMTSWPAARCKKMTNPRPGRPSSIELLITPSRIGNRDSEASEGECCPIAFHFDSSLIDHDDEALWTQQ